MAAYNSGILIEESIEAILAQTFPRFELIVVDDASRDDTVERVNRFRDPRIRLIRNPANVGVARARNIGVEAARAEYIAANDHDDVSLPDRLEKQVAFLDSHPDVLMVGAGVYDLKDGRRIATKLPAREHHVLRWHLMTHVPICHSSMCVRRSGIQEHHLYYDSTVDFADDFELYHRMAAVGRIAGLRERLVVYRVHANNASIVSGEQMNTRGSTMLARAHLRHLGIALDADAFGALWRATNFVSAPRSADELLLAGNALSTLLRAYLSVSHLSETEEHDVRLAASLQWWEFINMSAYAFGSDAYSMFDRIDSLTTYKPSVVERARPRLGRMVRMAVSRIASSQQP